MMLSGANIKPEGVHDQHHTNEKNVCISDVNFCLSILHNGQSLAYGHLHKSVQLNN